MIYVALNDISFVAFHGVYTEEQKLGNEFIVNVKVGVKDETAFIDYSILLDIVKENFSQRMDYLETLLAKIEKDIRIKVKPCDYLYVSIQKKNPPLEAVVRSSEVILEKKY
jgi:dihydroneopterin aldolase